MERSALVQKEPRSGEATERSALVRKEPHLDEATAYSAEVPMVLPMAEEREHLGVVPKV